MSRVIIVGAGGFGRETLDVVGALAAQRSGPGEFADVHGVPSANDLQRLRVRSVAYIGTVDSWLQTSKDAEQRIISVGAPHMRQSIAERIDSYGQPASPVVLLAATVGPRLSLAPGTVICSGARAPTNVTMGANADINAGAIVGHDTVMGDHVSVNPGAIVLGGVHVADQILVGAGATVLKGLAIGPGVKIGAGALVMRGILAGTGVKGVPAQ